MMAGRFFDEAKAFYDMKKRNNLFNTTTKRPSIGGGIQPQTERRKIKLILEQIKALMTEGLHDLIPPEEEEDLIKLVDSLELDRAVTGIKRAMLVAKKSRRTKQYDILNDACIRIQNYMSEGQKEKI